VRLVDGVAQTLIWNFCDEVGEPDIDYFSPDEDGKYHLGSGSWTWEEYATLDLDEAGARIHALFHGRVPTLELLARVPPILADAGLVVCRPDPAATDYSRMRWPSFPITPEIAALHIHRLCNGRAPDLHLLRLVCAVLDDVVIDSPTPERPDTES
jgi:hypothetical protein